MIIFGKLLVFCGCKVWIVGMSSYVNTAIYTSHCSYSNSSLFTTFEVHMFNIWDIISHTCTVPPISECIFPTWSHSECRSQTQLTRGNTINHTQSIITLFIRNLAFNFIYSWTFHYFQLGTFFCFWFLLCFGLIASIQLETCFLLLVFLFWSPVDIWVRIGPEYSLFVVEGD